jgi:septin family protein
LWANRNSILVVGAQRSGKSSFVNFLRASLALPARKQRHARDDFAPESGPSRFSASFVAHYLESELEDGERVGVTLWDSEGLEKSVMDLQLRQIASFIESKFDETFTEETKIVRSPGARDTHIHCVFLVLDPLQLEQIHSFDGSELPSSNGNADGKAFFRPSSSLAASQGHAGDETYLQVLRALQGKTTVVPVIAKADTVTADHMEFLKRSVWSSMKQSGLDHLEALGLDESVDDDASSSSESEHDSDAGVPTPGRGRHNSKKFDERDEEYLHPHRARDMEDRSTSSRLDLDSSSDADSAVIPLPKNNKYSATTSTPQVPLSILSPSPVVAHEPGMGRVGRRFPWGFADPYDPSHCDFVRLKEAVFGEWRSELREASRDVWYEQWRTTRLNVASPNGTARANTASPAMSKQGNMNSMPHTRIRAQSLPADPLDPGLPRLSRRFVATARIDVAVDTTRHGQHRGKIPFALRTRARNRHQNTNTTRKFLHLVQIPCFFCLCMTLYQAFASSTLCP